MTICSSSRCKRYITFCCIRRFTSISCYFCFTCFFSSINSISYIFSSGYTISRWACNCTIGTSSDSCRINSNFHTRCRSSCAHKTTITSYGKGYVPIFKVFITCATSITSKSNALSSSINSIGIQANCNRLIINSRCYAIRTSHIKFLVLKVHSAIVCTISNIKVLRQISYSLFHITNVGCIGISCTTTSNISNNFTSSVNTSSFINR